MARATISLPVPVSPVISTGSGVAAMRRAVVRISDICSEAQMQSVSPSRASAGHRAARCFSSRR